jgi:hypothetical protein
MTSEVETQNTNTMLCVSRQPTSEVTSRKEKKEIEEKIR